VITPPNDIPSHKIEAKALASLITELNIARRNSNAYPKGHPVIAVSLAKVLRVYDNLLQEHDEIILGVTSDSLMVDGVVLEKSNLVYKDFSRVLFERGIGALLFHKGMTIGELGNFTTILGLKREQIHKHGGIKQIWDKAGITAMTIRPIRYDLFKATDPDSITVDKGSVQADRLWDRFARELTLGSLATGESGETRFDPEILAKILNQKFIEGSIGESEVRAAITAFFESESVNTLPDTPSTDRYEKLAVFISNLSPEMRRQFEDISHERLSVSPVVFGLLKRLGTKARQPQNRYKEISGENEVSQKIKTIFRELDSEEFASDDYQRKLYRIIASDQVPRLGMEEVPDLMTTVETRAIEGSIGQILMNLVREGIESPEERNLLLQNLADMFGFFLMTGDYGQLLAMINQLSDGTFPLETQYRLREVYGRREFLEEILDGLTIWGKRHYGDIRSLIIKIGYPFVETLLDRLAEEKNMSIRRFYIDLLIEMGPMTQVPIINRLRDTRWYFLRNLLIILASQKDPSVVTQIRPLLRSEDHRLRHEALKTLVYLRDPQAEKLVMVDLNSQNQELLASAIQLAERCDSPAIAAKLTVLLAQGGYSQSECDRKCSIVHALGEIGRAEVLPELARILGSRSLFHSRQLTKLKSDIIASLPKYPATDSRPLLERFASGSGDISHLAEEALRIISGKKHE
jgi:hypothetical protein